MFTEVSAVYLHRAPVDFRQSINALSVIVEGAMSLAPWPEAVIELREEQLQWLLSGYDITRMRPHERVQYARVL